MIPVLTPEAMRSADRAGVDELGFTSLDLMENASRSCADIILDVLPPRSCILVLCGTGNNGGDGFAVARMLSSVHTVRVAWIGDHHRMTPETAEEFSKCVNADVSCVHVSGEESVTPLFHERYDGIIDALVGIGGSEELRGLAVPLLRSANACSCLRIAVDVPTGLNASTGKAHEHCFRAHHTITMAAPKSGLYLRDGKDVCGQIHVAAIGLTPEIIDSRTSVHVFEHADVQAMYTPRKSDTSKFDYGRICIIAGSRDMPGAAALSANAAIVSGAGLVEVCSTAFHAHLLPEVLQTHVPSTDAGTIGWQGYERIRKACDKAQCIVIGPGLGWHEETSRIVEMIIKEYGDTKPVIVDADGLRAVSCTEGVGSQVVLTPHAGEFARLREKCSNPAPSLSSAEELAAYLRCIIVAKGVPVRITDGSRTLWNVNGNPGMATAGSGDVAAGVIATMTCRLSSAPLLERVAAGVYIHAMAGDLAAEHFTPEGVTASRIVSLLHEALPAVVHGKERM